VFYLIIPILGEGLVLGLVDNRKFFIMHQTVIISTSEHVLQEFQFLFSSQPGIL